MLNRLTDAQVRGAKPRDRPYKLADGGGLHLLVMPSGARHWRYRYEIRGVENTFAIGAYPAIGLLKAREERDSAKKCVSEGKHPAQVRSGRRTAAIASGRNTFQAIAQEWIDKHRKKWSSYYLGQVEAVLGSDVFPVIGKLPIKEVTAHQLLSIVMAVSDREATTVAVLIRQWCSAIFRYAIATLRAEIDHAAALKGAIIRNKVKHKTPLKPGQVSELVEKLENCGGTRDVRTAIKLLLYTFVRPGELRGARWEEFDLDRGEWRIPAERIKMREPHFVPLSTQVVALLKERQALSRDLPHLFPNQRNDSGIMSPTTLNRFLERMGYGGKFSAHGFRATASTILNEMGYRDDLIERQLAHKERNKVRASYNQASYLVERKKMMQDWADFVDSQRKTDC